MSLREVWDKLDLLEEQVLSTLYYGISRGMPRSEVISQILTLAGDNWRKAKSYIPILKYEENNPFYNCQTDDYGNVIDPVTMEEIPLDELYHSMKEVRNSALTSILYLKL